LTDLSAIKQEIVDILLSDTDLCSLLGEDPAGDVPVYLGWQFGKHPILPSVTVTDIADSGEISGLNDGFDGINRYEWSYVVIQIDVWASDESSRDAITAQVRKALLLAAVGLTGLGLAFLSSSVAVVNEPNELVFRHSLRYNIFYELSAEVTEDEE
jgi:hypothetical protein